MENSDSSRTSRPRPLPQGGTGVPLPAQAQHGAPPLPSPAEGAAADRGASLPDLREEAANMLRLALAQDEAGTPLGISSRQAQVVLGQF